MRDLVQEPTWRAVLSREFDQPYFASLERFVQGELEGGKA